MVIFRGAARELGYHPFPTPRAILSEDYQGRPPFAKVNEATGESFTDSRLLAETDYTWQIKAVVDGRESEPSGTATARTRKAAP